MLLIPTRISEEPDFYVDSGERFISQEGLDNSASHLIPTNNILITTRVGIGKIAINRIDIAISQDLTGCIIDKDVIIPEFLAWYLKYDKINDYLIRISQGTTIKGITRDKLEMIKIPLPPLFEQQQIATILNKTYATIAAARENVAATKALKMRLINQFFPEA